MGVFLKILWDIAVFVSPLILAFYVLNDLATKYLEGAY